MSRHQYRAREQDLQQKFRWLTTMELEHKLATELWNVDTPDIQLELIRRGSSRTYFDRPSKVFGSDGSSVSFSSGADKPAHNWAHNWDRVVAAESAYLDEIMAKPLRLPDNSVIQKWIESNRDTTQRMLDQVCEKPIIRRIIPGLIDMSTSGVQPMSRHLDSLPIVSSYLDSISRTRFFDADAVIAADKDLQQVGHPGFSDFQKIGRGLRMQKIGDTKYFDYLSMIADPLPKTNLASTAFRDLAKTSTVRFLDTEDAMSLGTQWVKVSEPGLPTATEECKLAETKFDSSWFESYLEAASLGIKSMYYNHPRKPAIITARAPDFAVSTLMAGCSMGIEPIRPSAHMDVDCGFSVQRIIETYNLARTITIAKQRPESSGAIKLNFGEWLDAHQSTAKQTAEASDEDVAAATLAILGISKGETQ